MTTSAWQTPQLAEGFLKGVRGAIPGADLQLAVLGKIVQLWQPAPARILDLGCGDGILGRCLLELFPAAAVVFADFSEPMLAAARAKLGETPRATLVQADFSQPRWVQALGSANRFDVIVSGFAIHHQPDARKRALYGEIHGLLLPGGVFLNLEHVASRSPAGTALFDEFFIDGLYQFHRRQNPGADRTTLANTYYRRPDKAENLLAPVDEQCRWLEELGFRDVDCFCKVFELALFGGRKP